MRRRRYAVVAAGGTGGHLVPAVTVATALAAGRAAGAVELVGSRRGLEADLLAGTGLGVTRLPGRGFARSWEPAAVLANCQAAAALALATVMAVGLLVRLRPAVVVALGGYGCVPLSLAAAVLGVPVVLVNLDVVPGAASRLVARLARASAVAFAGTVLPRAVVTGTPLRPEIEAAAAQAATAQAAAGADAAGADGDGADAAGADGGRAAARAGLGLPGDRFTVGVVGGSLGARRLNQAAAELAGLWAARPDVTLYHVVGRRDADTWAATTTAATATGHAAGPAGGLVYRQVAYEERMDLFYRAADVVVARAGAMTVAELSAVGVPAVLVPLPGAPRDHQSANAAVLERAGGATVVTDAECTGARLADEIEALRGRPGRLEAMARAGRAVGRPQATEAVRAVVEAEARP